MVLHKYQLIEHVLVLPGEIFPLLECYLFHLKNIKHKILSTDKTDIYEAISVYESKKENQD